MLENKATIQQVISALQKHREYNFTKAHNVAENVLAIKAAATTTSLITMIIAALIVAAVSLFITRTLTKALGIEPDLLNKAAKSFANGDFNLSIKVAKEYKTSVAY